MCIFLRDTSFQTVLRYPCHMHSVANTSIDSKGNGLFRYCLAPRITPDRSYSRRITKKHTTTVDERIYLALSAKGLSLITMEN